MKKLLFLGAKAMGVIACVFIFMSSHAALGAPFSVQSIPRSVMDGDRTLWLEYRAFVGNLAAGVAIDSSSSDKKGRIFVCDIATQTVKLGPTLPVEINSVTDFALSPQGSVLLITATLSPAPPNQTGTPSISYSILRTPDLGPLIDVPLPLTEFTQVSVQGPDQDGNIYIGQFFVKSDNSAGIRNFVMSTNGVVRELFTLTDKLIGAVSPSGLIGAIPFPAEHLATYPVTIVDGRSDAVLLSGTPRENIGVVGILDNQLMALWVSSSTRGVFDLSTNTMKRRLIGLYGNRPVALASNAFAGIRSANGGSELTFFNATSEMTPGCVYPRNHSNRMSFFAAVGVTSGLSVIADGSKYQEPSSGTYLVTPNFDEPAANYCSRMIITPLRGCRKLFEVVSPSLIKKRNAKLPKTCSFRVALLTAKSERLSADLKVTSTRGGKSTNTRSKLTGKSVDLTFKTSQLSQVKITSILPSKSEYLDASEYISFD